MSTYDLDFLKDFSNLCRNMESTKQRVEDVDTSIKFVHQIYEDTLSGKLPALSHNSPIKRITPLTPFPEDEIDSIPQTALAKLSLQGDRGKRTLSEVLDIFQSAVIETGCNRLSGYLFGKVRNSSSVISSLARTLVAWIPINAIGYMSDPGACEVELSVLNWFSSIIGYGKEACGYLTSGASSSMVHGLMAARDDRLDSNPNVAYERCVVYLSELTHRSNRVALKVVGLGRCQMRTIPVDENFCMQTSKLEQCIKQDIKTGLKPFVVIGTAGTTDAGSIDPLLDIAHIADKYGLWFHVDAAIGGVCMVSEQAKALMQGMELSDSVALDCHKIFFQPPGLGAILLRDGNKLKKCMSKDDAYYLQDDHSKYLPMDYTFELSRPFRGLSLWFSMKVLGEEFYENVVNEKIQLAQYVADNLAKIPFVTIYGRPRLMIVLYRYEPPNNNQNDINSQLIMEMKKQEKMYIEANVIKGIIYQRLCFTSLRSHIEEIDEVIEVIKESISKLVLTE